MHSEVTMPHANTQTTIMSTRLLNDFSFFKTNTKIEISFSFLLLLFFFSGGGGGGGDFSIFGPSTWNDFPLRLRKKPSLDSSRPSFNTFLLPQQGILSYLPPPQIPVYMFKLVLYIVYSVCEGACVYTCACMRLD